MFLSRSELATQNMELHSRLRDQLAHQHRQERVRDQLEEFESVRSRCNSLEEENCKLTT